MAIVWCRELMKDRAQSGKYGETYTYSRSWLVRVDSPTESLVDITNATGVAWMDDHPDDASCKCLEFDTSANDDTGLLYTVKAKYAVPPVNNQDGGDPEQPGYIEGLMKIPIWSGSSSVTSGPVGMIVTNSANQPIEGLEQEFAEFRLTKTEYWLSHADWLADGRAYTNKVNADTWNGGGPRTWKCQGMSAQLQTENREGATLNYWEVTWEFAYRSGTWNLLPWDVGYSERCGSDGVPSASGEKWKTILGQDKKPVKHPVALGGGVALPAGTPPTVINDGEGVEVYLSTAFSTRFGSVYTP